ncbi:MAG: efflux RND transporter periplasmic adaptor subunit [Synergistaceae bacterium]|nr:efflux RND transporter periplasmic adaptor subunit [Synergistaceae bacterium]
MAQKRYKKLKGRLFFLAVIGIIAGGIWYYLDSNRESPLKFLTAPATKGNMRSVILATGKVQAVSMVSVGTQISGTLKSLYADFNSVVKKGDLIAVIDSATQEADLAQADASLRAVEADVAEARANVKLAEQKVRRSRELYGRDLIARSELDVDETSLLTARARLTSAEARVAAQEASVERARLQLGYTRIYSPVDGVVVTRNVDVGQTMAASFNTPTIVEIAEDLSRMQVEVNIDEADIGSVRDGQRVEFNVDAFPDRGFEGTVSQIRLSPASENNVISYTAIVSFINERVDGQNLIPGMTANVTLIVEEKSGVVMVPNAALRFRPLAGRGGLPMQPERTEGKSPTVYRLDGETPAAIEVERGITDGINTEIISGLDTGTEIIIGIDMPHD